MPFDLGSWYNSQDPAIRGAILGGTIGAGGLGIASLLAADRKKKQEAFLKSLLMGGLAGAGIGGLANHYLAGQSPPTPPPVTPAQGLTHAQLSMLAPALGASPLPNIPIPPEAFRVPPTPAWQQLPPPVTLPGMGLPTLQIPPSAFNPVNSPGAGFVGGAAGAAARNSIQP